MSTHILRSSLICEICPPVVMMTCVYVIQNSSRKVRHCPRFECLTTVSMNIKFLWNVTHFQWLYSDQGFGEGCLNQHFNQEVFRLLWLNMEAFCLCEMPGTVYLKAWRHMPEKLNVFPVLFVITMGLFMFCTLPYQNFTLLFVFVICAFKQYTVLHVKCRKVSVISYTYLTCVLLCA